MSTVEHEPIEGELVPYQEPAPMNLFGAAQPEAVIERAAAVASSLSKVLEDKRLFKDIQGRKHVLVEGWTLLGSMLGVFPVCTWTRKMEDGWEARVEARTRNGEVIGAAEAQCTRKENLWSFEPVGKNGQRLTPRDDHALRSMAQTRATAKALRLPFGFVVTLAGYAETPAEEMQSQASEPRITKAQNDKIAAMLAELNEKWPPPEGTAPWVNELRSAIGVRSRKDMTKAQASEAIEWLQKQIEAAEIPFG